MVSVLLVLAAVQGLGPVCDGVVQSVEVPTIECGKGVILTLEETEWIWTGWCRLLELLIALRVCLGPLMAESSAEMKNNDPNTATKFIQS